MARTGRDTSHRSELYRFITSPGSGAASGWLPRNRTPEESRRRENEIPRSIDHCLVRMVSMGQSYEISSFRFGVIGVPCVLRTSWFCTSFLDGFVNLGYLQIYLHRWP